VPDNGTPESVLFFVALVPDALEFIEVVLDQAIKRGDLLGDYTNAAGASPTVFSVMEKLVSDA